MPYLVRLADRALRDMEAIYEFIDAEASESAFAWFKDLAREIYSLERSSGVQSFRKARNFAIYFSGRNLAPI